MTTQTAFAWGILAPFFIALIFWLVDVALHWDYWNQETDAIKEAKAHNAVYFAQAQAAAELKEMAQMQADIDNAFYFPRKPNYDDQF